MIITQDQEREQPQQQQPQPYSPFKYKFFLKRIYPILTVGEPRFLDPDKRITYVSSSTPITISLSATDLASFLIQYAIILGENDPSNSPSPDQIVTSPSASNSTLTFTLPKELPDELYTIMYRVLRNTDRAVTSWYKKVVYLDNTPPAVSINIQDGAILTDNDVITITATDEGSGVAKIFYRIDGGEWKEIDSVAATVVATTSSKQ
ncbi:MAG: hypothetical protein QXQ68_05760 [Candidatus Nitrosocaldaceae archaeon]